MTMHDGAPTVLTTVDQWRDFANDVRRCGARVGLVPTMGALHDGHSALVRAATENGDVTLVTIFVNPLQFNDAQDLANYPSTLENDLARLTRDGAHAVATPTVHDMWPHYPAQTPTLVRVRGLDGVLEGAGRPGHFDGVATVVTKLFAITGPCRAYFGEKDFQQVAVVRQLVADLDLDVEIVVVPTVRNEQGLALSSRNARLSPEGLQAAAALPSAITLAQGMANTHKIAEIEAAMQHHLVTHGVDVAYAAIVDAISLTPTDDAANARIMVAGFVDGVRLIDNAPLVKE